jgi:hypothetical protein
MQYIDYCQTQYEPGPTPTAAPGAKAHVEFVFKIPMRILVLMFVVCLIAACDSDSAGPLLNCDLWRSCPGALVIKTEVVEGKFSRQRPDIYMPGDSILARISIQNRANVESDSLQIAYEGNGFAGYTILGESNGPEGWKIDPVFLRAGETRVVVDTFVVGGYTFDGPTRLSFYVWGKSASDWVEPVVTGQRDFPIATSGYEFEVVSPPPGTSESVQLGSRALFATRIRHRTDTGVLIRVSNPFQLPLDPIRAGHCFWDGDHCYVSESAAFAMPKLEPGREAYVEYIFNFDTQGHYHRWWSKTFTELGVCAQDGFNGGQCVRMPIVVTANFEADCTVTTMPQGVEVNDAVPDCGHWKDGSAYRFEAKKGDRYRVTLLSGGSAAFLSPVDGIGQLDPKLTELLIPHDGTYYVAVLHQGVVRFRLDQVS